MNIFKLSLCEEKLLFPSRLSSDEGVRKILNVLKGTKCVVEANRRSKLALRVGTTFVPR
jgi:hypothetical protein